MIGRYSKSIAVLIVGVQAWGLMVVRSPSSAITAGEWMTLVGYLVAFVLAFLVPNAPASVPAPPKVPHDRVVGGTIGHEFAPTYAAQTLPSKAATP